RSDFMEERIRVCVVSFKFSPLIGGAETRAEKQARKLQALGHDVMVVTLRHYKHWKRRELLDGLPVIRVGGLYNSEGRLRIGRFGHLSTDLTMFLTLWRLRHSYDIIHVCQLLPVVALVGQLVHKPVILSVQNTGPDKLQR